MNSVRNSLLLQRAIEFESSICKRVNRVCRRKWLKVFFSGASRLGDGILWYALTLVLPLVYGYDAIAVSLRMAIAGILGLIIYKIIKRHTERPRPYSVLKDIKLGTAPLDKYSFPSGHTLHAFSFSLICMQYYPQTGWFLIPVSLLIALSRVALGLHYPTDVLAGAAIGYLISLVGTMTIL
ncbi:hypothetical protein MNBD_GAMMA24-2636 [hydrothermal vent metagenome]|uniref:Phosphatidic acid phosphatase type 2/haloperoxidase domain-containing protein n=1 Tax=hydrothermal vent metagenome TaxID=652676 RepID=A0A3B1BDH8_9ZZZZ